MTTATTLQHIHSSNSNSTSITDIEVGLPFSSRPVSGVDLFIFPSTCWPVEREILLIIIIIIILVIITLDFITGGTVYHSSSRSWWKSILSKHPSSQTMNSGTKKNTPKGSETPDAPELEHAKINEVRKLIGPLSGMLAVYCSDACIARYLRARNWNVKKATKMLKASLKWRHEYKPEEIRWEDVASEAETGKIYRTNYKDKLGRTVLVMRPRCQNSKSIKGQIKYLVYCMENAILNLPENQEQMVWLIDFHGFSMSNISVKVTKETAHVLQEQYPERLGVAVLFDAPKIFEPFWKVVKPFLEPKTANKVKFAYSDDPNSRKILEDLFDLDEVEPAFGGRSSDEFDINKYAERMKEDDRKVPAFWKTEDDPAKASQPLALVHSANLDPDSDTSSDEKVDGSPSLEVDIEELSIDDSSPIKSSNDVAKDDMK